MGKMPSFLEMKTGAASGASEAAQALIESDLRELGVAARKLANHAVVLGGGLGFGSSLLKWLAFIAAVSVHISLHFLFLLPFPFGRVERKGENCFGFGKGDTHRSRFLGF